MICLFSVSGAAYRRRKDFVDEKFISTVFSSFLINADRCLEIPPWLRAAEFDPVW